MGDKWTLLVMRDLFAGLKRYGEFAGSMEKIPTNILAERLARSEISPDDYRSMIAALREPIAPPPPQS